MIEEGILINRSEKGDNSFPNKGRSARNITMSLERPTFFALIVKDLMLSSV